MTTNVLETAVLSFLLFAAQPAFADPRITAQPRNVSTLLGSNAQFSVDASGSSPLFYQWRLGGSILTGETNSSLTVTNVTLNHLGKYDVLVRDSVGEVTSAPAHLLLARWTELVTFGRSDSMSSCASSGSWPDYLAGFLGVPLRKYAVTGTPPPHSATMQTQVRRYLSNYKPTTNTLVAIWIGGVDMLHPSQDISPETSVAGQVATTSLLINGGARHILVPKLWPPEMLPFWTEWFKYLSSDKVTRYDQLLDQELSALQNEHPITFHRPDMFTFLTAVWNNPAAYGFRNPLGADFSCDRLHFNSPVHRLNAEQLFLSLTPPVRVESAARVSTGEIRLAWNGGAPPFRVERSTNLFAHVWEQAGDVTYSSTITLRPASGREFFRIQRLGQ
jgi:hypothetical protein